MEMLNMAIQLKKVSTFSISTTFHIKNKKKGIVRESFVIGNFFFSGVKNSIYKFLTPAVLLFLFSF